MVAFFLGNSLMFIFGAAGAAALGLADISDVMIAQGLLLPAIVVLGLNIWTTNDNALYASGLGFANITGMSSKTLSVINGIIGTVCALWLYNNFVGWLTFLSAAIPPVGGVIIADYLMNRRRYERFCDHAYDECQLGGDSGGHPGDYCRPLVTGNCSGQRGIRSR